MSCRLSISQLQERHSLDAVQSKTAEALLQAQVTKVSLEACCCSPICLAAVTKVSKGKTSHIAKPLAVQPMSNVPI